MYMYLVITVKQENCAVVLLCVLMDDTPTIDVMWIFCVHFFYLYMWIFVYKNAGVRDFYCAVNPARTYSTDFARIARIKSTHNFLLLR